MISEETQKAYDEAIRAAREEGSAAVRKAFEELMDRPGPQSPHGALSWIAASFLRPDDTWSGRGNELRRAHNDGAFDAFQRLEVRYRAN